MYEEKKTKFLFNLPKSFLEDSFTNALARQNRELGLPRNDNKEIAMDQIETMVGVYQQEARPDPEVIFVDFPKRNTPKPE